MKLLMVNQARERVSASWLRRWLAGLSRELRGRRLGRRELVLVFVSRAEMARLNQLYRGKKGPTDVLSFASAEEGVVGELVLCMPVIREQSRRTGLSVSGELGYMIVHGVLHLLGFDHETVSGEAEMFALQDRIYTLLEKKVGLK
jgi:probable rRNA maturation factor